MYFLNLYIVLVETTWIFFFKSINFSYLMGSQKIFELINACGHYDF